MAAGRAAMPGLAWLPAAGPGGGPERAALRSGVVARAGPAFLRPPFLPRASPSAEPSPWRAGAYLAGHLSSCGARRRRARAKGARRWLGQGLGGARACAAGEGSRAAADLLRLPLARPGRLSPPPPALC